MPNHVNEKILLIGVGPMSIAYAKVLQALDIEFIAIGRSEDKALLFKEETGIMPFVGGLVSFLNENKTELPQKAIVAVGVEALCEISKILISNGIKNILLEKPGGKNFEEIKALADIVTINNAQIFLAYNRRFFSSVIKAKEIIQAEGGVKSFNFEFTEWSHTISPLQKAEGVKEKWFLANSTHITDLAFYLGGKPKEMKSFIAGGNNWHPNATIFCGAGVSDFDALFNYQANWESPGRWVVEIITKNFRLIFKPIEELQIQEIGSVAIKKVDVNNELGINFKPGLFLQVKSWLENSTEQFCTIQEQNSMSKWYKEISGYE